MAQLQALLVHFVRQDFSLLDNHIGWDNIKMGINDLEIVRVYGYEGSSDPAAFLISSLNFCRKAQRTYLRFFLHTNIFPEVVFIPRD
jgi:hypothetical protein